VKYSLRYCAERRQHYPQANIRKDLVLLAFGFDGVGRRPGAKMELARATNCCGKTEFNISSRHDESCPSAGRDCEFPVPRRQLLRAKGLRKKRVSFMLRNPLKSLDSDERIQGNPRKSNPHNCGFSARNCGGQGNPNGSTEAPGAATNS
jgi:hypothetical protein